MCMSNPRTCCRITTPSVVVPQGTTTIFWDPHELANVLGLDGMRYAVEATRDLPLRFIVQASSCVPAAPGLEISGADFKAAEIRELMSWPEVAGLAEVMDMRAVLEAQPRMIGILERGAGVGQDHRGPCARPHRAGAAGLSVRRHFRRPRDHLGRRCAGKAARRLHRRNSRLARLPASRCRRRHQHAAGHSDQPDDLHRRRVSRRSGRPWRHQRRAAAADPLRPRPAAGDPLRHHQQRDPPAARRSRPDRGGTARRPRRARRSAARSWSTRVYANGRHVATGGQHARAARAGLAAAGREHHEDCAAHARRFPSAGAGRRQRPRASCAPSRARASIPGARPRSRCATALPWCRTTSALMTIVHRHGRNDREPADWRSSKAGIAGAAPSPAPIRTIPTTSSCYGHDAGEHAARRQHRDRAWTAASWW